MSNDHANSTLGIILDDQIKLPVNLVDQAEITSFLKNHPAEKETKNSATIRFFLDDQARP